MSVNLIKYFLFEKYYKRIGFSKENSYYSIKRVKKKKELLILTKKLIKKKPDPHNAKEHYPPFI